MKLINHQFAFIRDIAKLYNFVENSGDMCTLGWGFRTTEMQALFVKTGLSKTMNSNHPKRLAQDLNFFVKGVLTYKKEDLQRYGDYWESLSPENRWGGNFKDSKGEPFEDTDHFERNA
jgi:hypothetical protein